MIEVSNLSRYYGSRCAVEEVSFSIGAHEVVGFLGLNGAGKTTTLKVLAGLLLPSDGSVLIDGEDLVSAPITVRSRIGFLPEDPPMYTDMTVSAFLAFVGQLRGMDSGQVAARLPSVLATTHLSDVSERVIDELSHGYRKRVGIASAIIHGPKLVILDEPISGLDPVQIVEMRQVISALSSESTVLISSHILSEISQTCDRILVLSEGRLVAQGTETELAGRFHMGGSVDLTVRGSREAAHGALSGVEGVKKIIDLGENGEHPRLRVSMTADVREELVGALLGSGLGLRRMDDAHDELEEVFLDLTRSTKAGAA